MNKGKVYLIGAGPGDPELITLKGKKLLEKADCIIYDRLANKELLSYISPDKEMIFVGKKPGKHTYTQEKINELLIKKAMEGKTVARLKGGDPFVFGRGGEECLALNKNGISFEIIPGITSAIAVPAYGGIPVTHRDYNSSFTIITGHEDPDKEESLLNWAHLATGKETLIFLMGVSRLEVIVNKLIKHGKPVNTPIAIIGMGTTTWQKTFTSTLGKINGVFKGIDTPSEIIIGEVVKLRDKIKWFEKLPLFSKTIVVTRAREQASNLSEELRNLGARVIEFPVIKIKELENYNEADNAINRIDEYKWIIFTSPNGVKLFLKRVYKNGRDIRSLGKIKICAIGPQTAKELKDTGIIADYIPPKYVAEELVENFPKIDKGTKILLPRAKEARDTIPVEMSKQGASPEVVPIYETVIEESNPGEMGNLIKKSQIDMITFTSSSTVRNFVEIVSKEDIDFNAINIAAIGPITANTAIEYGFNVKITANEYTIPGLIKSIVDYFSDK